MRRLVIGMVVGFSFGCGDAESIQTLVSDIGGATGADATDTGDTGSASGSDAAGVGAGDVTVSGDTAEVVCTAGETFCNGASVVSCNATGTARTTTACPSGTCAFGACTDACTPGQSYCEGDALVVCGDDKVPKKTACDAGCANGACNALANVCEPNAITCDVVGKKLLACAPDGKSAVKKEDCPYGCSEGQITCSSPACAPGETRCAADDPKVVELCLDDQSGWKKAETSCKVSCKAGACFVPSCDAGVRQCGVLGIEQCNAEGSGFDVAELCKAGCTTTADGPACKLCKKGLKQCQDGGVVECIDELDGFVSTATCSDIQACQNGACIDVVQLADAAGVDANYTKLLKAMAVCFIAKTVGSCRTIDTLGLGSAITVDDLETWFCAGADDPAFVASFGSDETYLAISDIIGSCSVVGLNISDLTLTQDEITAGKSGLQCIGFDDPGTFSNHKEIVVDLCVNFPK